MMTLKSYWLWLVKRLKMTFDKTSSMGKSIYLSLRNLLIDENPLLIGLPPNPLTTTLSPQVLSRHLGSKRIRIRRNIIARKPIRAYLRIRSINAKRSNDVLFVIMNPHQKVRNTINGMTAIVLYIQVGILLKIRSCQAEQGRKKTHEIWGQFMNY